jgi:hypothetical protein
MSQPLFTVPVFANRTGFCVLITVGQRVQRVQPCVEVPAHDDGVPARVDRVRRGGGHVQHGVLGRVGTSPSRCFAVKTSVDDSQHGPCSNQPDTRE